MSPAEAVGELMTGAHDAAMDELLERRPELRPGDPGELLELPAGEYRGFLLRRLGWAGEAARELERRVELLEHQALEAGAGVEEVAAASATNR